ncbi:hypothetical protein TeGR_g12071 [Tetraparma gracilis]|uniref:UV radiation resistance-associated gene protein n=1 Tax=Tetraparma gracilis TaxID=2962635 RepID=A0ABQ6MEA5_9STRA|nr:hypothetical protein TeGR_g12071 [Tetraparma gracilis]
MESLRVALPSLRSSAEQLERDGELSLLSLRSGAGELRELAGQVRAVEAQARLVEGEAGAVEERLRKGRFLLEARQVKLLGQLARIFPIERVSEDVYAIRGLQVPRDYSGDDERLSSALGLLCHLLLMTSKYLGVPLRYKLLCHASRSAVQDGASVYPLFKARQERERFDRACVLLERDADSLLSARAIRAPPRTHVLGKVGLLYQETVSPHSRLKSEGKSERRQQSIMQEAIFR